MQAVQDAFASAAELLPKNTQTEAEDRAERYFFFAGDEPGMPHPGGMRVATPCVPTKTIWRGQVTPCISVPQRSRVEEIPEGREIYGSRDAIGRKASYMLFSGPEADNLLAQYGSATDHTKQWGLVELKALRGKSLDEVKSLQITATFFPNWPHDVPETNEEMVAHILSVKKTLVAERRRETGDITDILLQCADEMIAAARQAQAHQANIIGENNMRVTLPSTDANFKEKFDGRDRLFATRSGLALAVNSQRANQSDVLQQVIGAMQPQQAAQIDPNAIAAIVAATMQAMQAQNAPTPPAPVAPETQPKPQPKKAA